MFNTNPVVFSEAAFVICSYLAKYLKKIVQRMLCLLFSLFTASDNRQCLGKCVSEEKLL